MFEVYVAIGLVLAAAGIALLGRSREAGVHERIRERLWRILGTGERRPAERSAPWPVRWLLNQAWRAGVSPGPHHAWSALGALMVFALVGAWLYGWPGTLAAPALATIAVYAYLEWSGKKRRRLLVAQLPAFLEQVIRLMSTGRSLDNALMSATEDSVDPLKAVMGHVLLTTRLGGDLDEALQEAAGLYGVKELGLVALAVRINRRFGSGVRDLLNSVIAMIRRDDQARREFKAMTAETRLSAWVLALVPVTIAAYMVHMNPVYLASMWDDDYGQKVLLFAVGMQVAGTLVIYRMTRSV